MEPIVIDRHTGKLISVPEIVQEQRDTAWEMILKAHVKKHPEIFLPSEQKEQSAGESVPGKLFSKER